MALPAIIPFLPISEDGRGKSLQSSPFSPARNYHLVNNKNNNVHKNAYIRIQSVCRKCNC